MDRTWKLEAKKLDEAKLRAAGETVAKAYEGVSVRVEKEDPEFITFFFDVPWDEDPDMGTAAVEITVYALGRDGLILSLEADAADNEAAQDDADQLAEDLATELRAEPVDV